MLGLNHRHDRAGQQIIPKPAERSYALRRTVGHIDAVFGKVRDDGGSVALVDSGDPAAVKRVERWVAGGRGSTGRKNRERPSSWLQS